MYFRNHQKQKEYFFKLSYLLDNLLLCPLQSTTTGKDVNDAYEDVALCKFLNAQRLMVKLMIQVREAF